MVRVNHMKPRIFIGSSVEGKPIADAIQANLTHEAYSTVWNQNIFSPSSYALESLLKAVANHDFSILVFSPDDVLRIREATAVVPRTNVVFEAALFIGKHGRDRCFFVHPRNHPDFTLPTDLQGIVSATYDEEHFRENPQAAVGSACTQIRDAINNSASFRRTVTVEANLQLADPATSTLTFPKKLNFRVTNPETSPVVVTSCYFEMAGPLRGHADRSAGSKNKFKVEFLDYKDNSGTDIHQPELLHCPSN